MSFFDDAAADASEILAEVGRNVVFRNVVRKAMIARQEMAFDLQTGGMAPNGQIILKLRAADFIDSAVPSDAERITFNGIEYRIVSVSRLAPGPWFELHCEPLSQR